MANENVNKDSQQSASALLASLFAAEGKGVFLKGLVTANGAPRSYTKKKDNSLGFMQSTTVMMGADSVCSIMQFADKLEDLKTWNLFQPIEVQIESFEREGRGNSFRANLARTN